ncbi:MAG: hypothetical protein K8R77_03975, partial [Anaerolineaceae bacterium]|nr:hypothetical protein [Anaerolineaceae bacterium]
MQWKIVGMVADLPVGDPGVVTTVCGGLLDVDCELCGAVRAWVAGEEGRSELLKRCERANKKRAAHLPCGHDYRQAQYAFFIWCPQGEANPRFRLERA